MNILRKLVAIPAALVVLAGTAVGLAVPAQAAQVLEGVFTYTSKDQSGTWSIFPICVPVVGDLRVPLYLAIGCRLNISPSAGLGGGTARLSGDLWTFTQPVREGIKCQDGTFAPTVEVFRFSDATMSGTRNISHTGACGAAPAIVTTDFTLSYQGPLEIPSKSYPLICQPGGLRRCF